MGNILKIGTLAGLISALAACAVGPDYQAPTKANNIELASAYEQAEKLTNWWNAFGDEDLNQLIDQALKENRTLFQAQANVLRAYAIFRDSDNDLLPKGSLNAGYEAGKNITVLESDDDTIARGYNAGANLTWDVDLFGKVRRAIEASLAEAEQADILWHDAQLQIISQVAATYGDYRGAQFRLKVAEQNLANLRQTRTIVKARFQAGFASELEMARIDAQVFQVEASVPQMRNLLARAEATLSALLAKKPGELALSTEPELPQLSKPVALVPGENYLRYRADVASSERALAASTARIGVATADLYPNVSVSGFLGFLSGPGLTLGGDTKSWSVAPTISWQAADLGSIKARIRQAEANSDIALAQFEQQVFDALADMQFSLQSYNFSRQQQQSTEHQWQASERAMILARQRFEAGSGEFLELLEAQRDALQSREQLAVQEQQSFNRLVDIYRAFGGGISVI
ncbi:efflux transporter outer membrane subunit [Paraglaciecola chathamensis]|uniref:RND efflux system, outer membrane lipoprotein, NodT n=1 Tax=Paraglaciecola chathamensis S18K6 TaxID=1127672 RepID=A0AAV3UVJ3_9ALTE|nr:TolC family protein [Paraglaciecola chathamensis]GAC08943.1 RND efflux system, outer membrane lipoprotein, NodT [Paraglaciecola chathamensis S18K6]